MVDLRDPNVALQFLVGHKTGYRIPAEQISGTQVGYVLDNDATNPVINQPGQCRVILPAYSPKTAFGPVSYPGTLVPPGGGIPGPAGPGGTQCTVSFVPPTANSPSAAVAQITNFINWPPVSGADDPPIDQSSTGQTFYNTTLDQSEVFNGSAWVASGGGSGGGTEDFSYFLAG